MWQIYLRFYPLGWETGRITHTGSNRGGLESRRRANMCIGGTLWRLECRWGHCEYGVGFRCSWRSGVKV